MKSVVLTADQIYALAYVQKAKYLDYYYISLASQFNDNKIWLGDNIKTLVSQGIMVEDFSGDTAVDSEVENLISPLYCSTKESSLDIAIFADTEKNLGYRFHFSDGKITMAKTVEGGFEISEVSLDDIRTIVESLIPSDYSAASSVVDISIDASKVSRVFVVKNVEKDIKSVNTTLVEYDGVIYETDDDGTVHSVSKQDFADELISVLTEV